MKETCWFEGDIHNHEDGSVPIEEHIETVRKAGYDFICLQYKDMEDPERIPDSTVITREDLLVIPGAEQAFQSSRNLWAHFGFMPFAVPMPDTITDHFDIENGLSEAERRSPGCLKIVHHPSDRRWTMKDLTTAHRAGTRFLELNPSDESIEFAISLWDRCLSSGLSYYATLSTDAHGLGGIRRFGHVKIQASSLTQPEILSSLRSGTFVAAEEGCRATPVKVPRPGHGQGGEYRILSEGAVETRFVGFGGSILGRADGATASYRISGNEGYVRGEVVSENGLRFFTQPIMIPRG